MYIIHKKIKRDENVGFYGQREDISLRINTETHLQAGKFDWDPLHYHIKSTQFFIVTQGEMIVEVDGVKVQIDSDQVLEIKPATRYRGIEIVKAPCVCITIGTYNIEGDKVVIES